MEGAGSLLLYEEITLLAMRNDRGTSATDHLEFAIAGAALAELLLDHRILIAEPRKQLVEVGDSTPVGDAILDEFLQRIASGKRRASLKDWVPRLAGTKDLRHRAARRLCERGILRAEEEEILLMFKRRVYPEIDPVPEREVVERLRSAIFLDGGVEASTAALVSLASATGLLKGIFGGKEVKARKKRIEQITNGELVTKATKEAIEACQAACMIAVIIPTIIASSGHH